MSAVVARRCLLHGLGLKEDTLLVDGVDVWFALTHGDITASDKNEDLVGALERWLA